jgi:hypothetical protein
MEGAGGTGKEGAGVTGTGAAGAIGVEGARATSTGAGGVSSTWGILVFLRRRPPRRCMLVVLDAGDATTDSPIFIYFHSGETQENTDVHDGTESRCIRCNLHVENASRYIKMILRVIPAEEWESGRDRMIE